MTVSEDIYRAAMKESVQASKELTGILQRKLTLDVNDSGFVAIEQLAFEGQNEAVTRLLQLGASKNHAVSGYARSGNLEKVDELVAAGANKDWVVHGAARGDANRVLVKYGEETQKSRDIAVFGAAVGGHREKVADLIDGGYASPLRALAGAVKGGNSDLIEYIFIHYGGNRNLTVFGAAMRNDRKFLDEIRISDANKDSAVEGAAVGGHIDLVMLLLESGANPNKAILGAARGGHFVLLNELIIKEQVKDNKTVLDDAVLGAARGGHTKIVQHLIGLGANPNKAVVGAAQEGNVELVEMLILNNNANKDLAVYAAAQKGHSVLVRKLIHDQKASPNRAVLGAIRGRDEELVKDLLGQGESLDSAVKGAQNSGRHSLANNLLTTHLLSIITNVFAAVPNRKGSTFPKAVCAIINSPFLEASEKIERILQETLERKHQVRNPLRKPTTGVILNALKTLQRGGVDARSLKTAIDAIESDPRTKPHVFAAARSMSRVSSVSMFLNRKGDGAGGDRPASRFEAGK
jgi:ankyrin repeat protein